MIQSGVCGDFCIQEDNDDISVPFYVCVQPFTHFGVVLWPDAPFDLSTVACVEIPRPKCGLWLSSHSEFI